MQKGPRLWKALWNSSISRKTSTSALLLQEPLDRTSEEYKLLVEVQAKHPDYKIVRREIKKNPHKESYCGLTYSYMDGYIATHDPTGEIWKAYTELRHRAACHSIRYAHIKKWFLGIYPEIDDFSIQKDEPENEPLAA